MLYRQEARHDCLLLVALRKCSALNQDNSNVHELYWGRGSHVVKLVREWLALIKPRLRLLFLNNRQTLTAIASLFIHARRSLFIHNTQYIGPSRCLSTPKTSRFPRDSSLSSVSARARCGDVITKYKTFLTIGQEYADSPSLSRSTPSSRTRT